MKKKISAMLFLTVLLTGLWQGVKSLFVWLFGDRHRAPFWRIIMSLITLAFVVAAATFAYVGYTETHRYGSPQFEDEELSQHYTYRHSWDVMNQNSLIDNRTRKPVLEGLRWVQRSHRDSLVIFAKAGSRGVFNLNTGRIVVPLGRYQRAWVYAEGRALAETQDSLYILDTEGKVVGSGFPQNPDAWSFTFRDGYCRMYDADGKAGFVDRNGRWGILPQYDEIQDEDCGMWFAKADSVQTVYDRALNVVLSGHFRYVSVCEDGIYVALDDHTEQRYSLTGELLDNFLFEQTDWLRYDTGKRVWREDEGEQMVEELASCRYYRTSAGYYGLMDMQGHPITRPLYKDIDAVGKNLFFCSYDCYNEYGTLLDEKGRPVNR